MASRGPEGVSAFVIDASMAASWFLPDEADEQTQVLAERAALVPPLAPSLFLHEMRSLFVMAERCVAAARATIFSNKWMSSKSSLARTRAQATPGQLPRSPSNMALTSYDATYLSLAIERDIPLATLDRKLAAAAKGEGVEVEGPLRV